MEKPDTPPHLRTRPPLPHAMASLRALVDRPRVDLLLYVVVAAGVLARLHAALCYSPTDALWSDPGRHWLYGQNPALDSPMSGVDPIGYQVWISVVAKIALQDRLANAIYAGILSAVTPWIWYRFLREALPSGRLALAGWAILGILPSWIGIYSYFMTETLFLPLLGLALWLTWVGLRVRDTRSLGWAAAAWLAASLTRAVAVPIGILAVGALLNAGGWRAKRVLLVAGLTAAFLIPPAYRSYRILGAWAPFGWPTLNRIYMESARHTIEFDLYKNARSVHYVYGFACPAMGEAPLEPLSSWKTSRTGKVHFEVEMDHGARDWNRALREHRAPLPVRMRMMAENWVYLLFGRSWPDCNPARLWDRLAIHTRWIWAPLLLFVLWADLRHLLRRRTLPLLPTLTLTAWLLVAVLPAVPIEGRYRKPLEGLLIASALWAVSAGAHRRKEGSEDSSALPGEDESAAPEKIPAAG